MIRSVLPLRAAAGRDRALEDFYVDHGVLDRARAFPGCQAAVLLRSIDSAVPGSELIEPTAPATTTHLVIADWDTAADYQRWVDEPWRAALSGQLADLLDTGNAGPLVGQLYEVV